MCPERIVEGNFPPSFRKLWQSDDRPTYKPTDRPTNRLTEGSRIKHQLIFYFLENVCVFETMLTNEGKKSNCSQSDLICYPKFQKKLYSSQFTPIILCMKESKSCSQCWFSVYSHSHWLGIFWTTKSISQVLGEMDVKISYIPGGNT